MDEPPSVAEWLKSSGCKRGHGNDFAKWGPLTKEESGIMAQTPQPLRFFPDKTMDCIFISIGKLVFDVYGCADIFAH